MNVEKHTQINVSTQSLTYNCQMMVCPLEKLVYKSIVTYI